MKKNVLKLSFIIAFVSIIGGNMYHNFSKTQEMSDLTMNNIEALAIWEGITDWWDSKIYDCQSVSVWRYDCMKYKDVPRESGSWEVNIGNFDPEETVCGYFLVYETDCVSGSSVAHCWDC